MSVLAVVIYSAIVASAALGVYLRRRQIDNVGRRKDEVPADFSGEVAIDEHRRAAAYTIARTRLSMAHAIYDALVAIAFLLAFLAPLHGVVAQAFEPGLTRSVALVVAFGAIAYCFDLPFALAETFWLEARFGFNRATPASFAMDQVKGMALELLVAVPALYAMFALMNALPNTWWLLAYVGFIAFVLLFTIIYPTLIAPLFNTFTPLPEGETKRRMEALLAKCGFEAKGLFVMDASTRSSRGNAYFSGFGKAKRIVFFDTLLERHGVEEIESILAHELGHFKFGHIRRMLAYMAALGFIGFAFLSWALSADGLAAVFGLPHDPGLALCLALIVKQPATHLLSPLLAWRSRRAEFEADDFARQIVGKEPMIAALTRLSRDNLATLTPDRLYAAFYYSHPPIPERVAHLRQGGAGL
jgi:STE24 endopeptidase